MGKAGKYLRPLRAAALQGEKIGLQGSGHDGDQV